MQRIIAMFIAFAFIAACGGGEESSGFSYDGPVTKIDWSTNAAQYRGQDGTFLGFECDPNPDQQLVGTVWGTNMYSDDSSVCAAGVHSGAISFADGGVVVIEVQPSQEGYTGSNSNGVESADWGTWGGSFSVMQ